MDLNEVIKEGKAFLFSIGMSRYLTYNKVNKKFQVINCRVVNDNIKYDGVLIETEEESKALAVLLYGIDVVKD